MLSQLMSLKLVQQFESELDSKCFSVAKEIQRCCLETEQHLYKKVGVFNEEVSRLQTAFRASQKKVETIKAQVDRKKKDVRLEKTKKLQQCQILGFIGVENKLLKKRIGSLKQFCEESEVNLEKQKEMEATEEKELLKAEGNQVRVVEKDGVQLSVSNKGVMSMRVKGTTFKMKYNRNNDKWMSFPENKELDMILEVFNHFPKADILIAELRAYVDLK